METADITKVIILATIVGWVIWDVIAYTRKTASGHIIGNIATESWTLKKWAYYAPGISCLMGILIGHVWFTFGTPEQLCPQGVLPLPIASPAPAVVVPLDETTDGVLIPFKKAQ